MPRIELIPETLYGPNDPIHWEIDNLPLKNIITRQNLINLALDDVLEEMRDAIGTAGSVANRLNQSLEPDGSLKDTAIDSALHSIESHTDGSAYVRMSAAQSAKVDLVADEATDLALRVNSDGSSLLTFDSGTVKIEPSSTVTPSIEAPDILRFHMTFPDSAAHQHNYGKTPVHVNLVTPDFINYKVNSVASEYIDESLGIFINGVRVFEDDSVYVPGPLVDDPWTLMSFTSDSTSGTFELSTAITEDDIIKVDYDISLV
jgi:hypothetical protein